MELANAAAEVFGESAPERRSIAEFKFEIDAGAFMTGFETEFLGDNVGFEKGLLEAAPVAFAGDVDPLPGQRIAKGAGEDDEKLSDLDWSRGVDVFQCVGVEDGCPTLFEALLEAEEFGGLAGAAETGE